MSKIFELFGYRLDAWGEEAQANCAKAWCPFMGAECDGGGNRYASAIELKQHPEQHNGPGINYRQVWARMVSQLIVKSQVGMAWGGKTIWLIQDVLADYISTSTALDLKQYLSEQAHEVNILSFGYGEVNSGKGKDGIVALKKADFYAGPIMAGVSESTEQGGFVEIIKIGAPPPKTHLWRALFLKPPCATLHI